MKKNLFFYLILLFSINYAYSQTGVKLLKSQTFTSKGAVALGDLDFGSIPNGTSRMMVVTTYIERVHSTPGNNHIIANYSTISDKFLDVTLNNVGLTDLNWNYAISHNASSTAPETTQLDETNLISVVQTHYINEENLRSFSSGILKFTNLQQPNNAGDEIIVSAQLYDNVYGLQALGRTNLSSSSLTPFSVVKTSTTNLQALQPARTEVDRFYVGISFTNREETLTTNFTNIISQIVNNVVGSSSQASTIDGLRLNIDYTKNQASSPTYTVTRGTSLTNNHIGGYLYVLNPIGRVSTLTGKVHHDITNNSNVDGTGTNLGAFFVNFINSNNMVTAVASVNSDGSLTIIEGEILLSGTYTAQLTINKGIIGNAPPLSELSTNWIYTGESRSTTGNDGTVDGKLTFSPTTNTVNNLFFGIRHTLDTDNDGINDTIDLDDDNDGILDTVECNSNERIVNGVFPTSGDNTNILNGWSVGGTTSPVWPDATGKINLNTNGLEFRRDESTVTTVKQNMSYKNLRNGIITLSNVKWYRSTNTVNQTATEQNFNFELFVGGKKYLTITNPNGYQPTVTAQNGATTTTTQLSRVDVNGAASSVTPSIIIQLPNDSTLHQGEVELRFTAGTSPRNVHDLMMSAISITSCVDTDNDGLQDVYDLDSDGDGCYDAIEGAGNITTAQITSGRINGSVSATGIPTAVGAGQGAGVAYDISKSECLDSDSDGVPNYLDLDNDNDGILDSIEMFGNCDTNSIYSITGYRGVLYDNTETSDINTWNQFTTQNRFPTTSYRSIANFDYYQFEKTKNAFDIVFTDTDSRSPYGFTANNTRQLRNFTGTGLSSNTNNYDFALEFSKVITKAEVGTYNFKLIEADNHVIIYKNNLEVFRQSDGWAVTRPIEVGDISFVEGDVFKVIWIEEGSYNTQIELRATKISGQCIKDTDADGIPNYLDTDSDGDGCPDAIEGGDNVKWNELRSNNGISIGSNGGVDANGIPNLVNPRGNADVDNAIGQSIGSSTNSSVATCITIDARNDNFTNTTINNTVGGVAGNVNKNDYYNRPLIPDSSEATPTSFTYTLINNGGITGASFSTNGDLNVPAGLAPKVYTLTYTICSIANPTVCDTATIVFEVYLDTDGDGISDVVDLDDDNDGILDTDEIASCSSLTTYYSQNFGTGTRTNFESLTPTMSTTYVYEQNTYTTSDDATNLQDGEYAVVPNLNDLAAWSMTTPGATGNAWVTSNDHTGDTNGRMAVFNASRSFTENFITTNGITVPANKTIKIKFWAKNLDKSPANMNPAWEVNRALPSIKINILNGTGSSIHEFTTGTIPRDEQWHEYSAYVQTGTNTSIGFSMYNIMEAGNGNDLAIDDITITSICDTDNDGKPNSLDLDSDGDGCADAIEGEGNILEKNLKSNKSINSTIDTNGVPTLVNGGQPIGSSANAAVNACICTKPANTTGTALNTNVGITTVKNDADWPQKIKGAHLALESKTKGLVVSRVNTTSELTNITNPKEGMIVFDLQDNCLKIYSKGMNSTTYSWKCFDTQTCPDN